MRIEIDGHEGYAYSGGRPFDATRPVVAMVHGAQHDHSVWALQSRWLAHHGYAVLAVDLPGHGRSAGPPLADVESMATWLLRALGAVGAPRATVVGHSMGALVALEAAGRAPDAVEGVALVGAAVPMAVSDVLLDAARDDEDAAFDMINHWSHARLVHRPGAPGPGFSVFVQNLRLMQRQPRGTLLVDFTACNAYARGLERAKALRCPVLLVTGERDQMTPPRAARALAEAIDGIVQVRIPGCGHAIPAESPDALREALAGWLADDVARARSSAPV